MDSEQTVRPSALDASDSRAPMALRRYRVLQEFLQEELAHQNQAHRCWCYRSAGLWERIVANDCARNSKKGHPPWFRWGRIDYAILMSIGRKTNPVIPQASCHHRRKHASNCGKSLLMALPETPKARLD